MKHAWITLVPLLAAVVGMASWGARIVPVDYAAGRSMHESTLNETNPGLGLGAQGDASRGKLVFQRRCTGCHAIDGDREGPRLAGVFGRKAGSVRGFEYSAGLKNSGLTWSEATLERWLTDPDLIAHDTKMDFRVAKAEERADLIAYLKHEAEGAKPSHRERDR